jgi:hypothetical protein
VESNSRVILEQFLAGFAGTAGNTHELHYLNRVNSQDQLVKAFAEAEHVLLVFPLYTDAMPAMVKTFIESLAPVCGREGNPSIGFIVHSAFPEAIHARYVERYLRKLAGRLGCSFSGTIVRGGSEGIRLMPPVMMRGLFKRFRELGAIYGRSGRLDDGIAKRLAKGERHSRIVRLLIGLMAKLGMTNGYWNGQLKKNNAYARRFARPYVEEGP